MKNFTFLSKQVQRTFLLSAFFFLTVSALQAQSNSSAEAVQNQLELKLESVYQSLEAGTIQAVDAKIADMFIAKVATAVNRGTSVSDAIEIANKVVLAAYPEHSSKVDRLKSELSTIMNR